MNRPVTRIGRWLVLEGGKVYKLTIREWLACGLSMNTRLGVTFTEPLSLPDKIGVS